MATVFISHANQDDALVGDLLGWLHRNGFRDTFVDHLDILGGENWTDRLRDQAAACRVVICVITRHWLASSDCFNEFQAAWYMGKSILPVFLVDLAAPPEGESGRRLRRVLTETQGIDLRSAGAEGAGLTLDEDPSTADLLARSLRAFGAQSEIGLDPTAFATDPPSRPTPFPGLVSFGDTDADAAIFYGRSREIAEAIEELRSMRANADRRPLVILGVSGAGKSSVLKAGILPRLRRETQAWLPLRTFRPGIDPLGAFAEAISRTFADLKVTIPPGQIRANLERALSTGALPETLNGLADRLRTAAGAPGATILIAVDQAEELLRTAGDAETQLGTCLAEALSGRRGWLVALTIRTDSFPELQNHPSFRDLKARGYDLRQLPPFRFAEVIEGPAARYGVKLSPTLVDAFMEDAPKRDALPLLAFTLQRLWDQFSASGELRLEDYQALGGMSGLIADAAEKALVGQSPGGEIGRLPSATEQQQRARLAESAFIPALVDVDESGSVTRRTADWGAFSEDQQSLLHQFEAWRLVVRRGAGTDATVEVAHEALFREWSRMRDWLEPEIDRIEVLRGTADAARLWDQAGRPAVLLNHRGSRLAAARGLLAEDRYAERLGAVERAYLAACARLRRRAALTVAAAAVLALAAVGAGAWSYMQSEQRMIAERRAGFNERVAVATGAADISTLESFTHYILNDPYARTRDDRFDTLRRVLTGATAAADPQYAIAEYAIDAVDVPDDTVFELEYSAERVVDTRLFPVLWRSTANRLAERWGLPAPGQFRLIENPDYPPGRVVIRRAGEVVFDATLPGTDARHMLDVRSLDRDDLRRFFDENAEAFTSAEAATRSPDYYYVPDWSVPLWNAGRDRNANSRVLPPGVDFTMILRTLLLERPGIVLDDVAVREVLKALPAPFDVTVREFVAIRGARTTEDVLDWARAGHPLRLLPFALASFVADDAEGLALGGAVIAPPVPDSVNELLPPPVEADAEDAPPDEMEAAARAAEQARRSELAASLRHVTFESAPVRVLVSPTTADIRQPSSVETANSPTIAGDPSAGFAAARDTLKTRLMREFGLTGIEVALRPDARIEPGHFAVVTLDSDWTDAVVSGKTAADPQAVFDAIFEQVFEVVSTEPQRFVLPQTMPAYLEASSAARRSWALKTFSHTDLARLYAALLASEKTRPMVRFDWLLGALVYSVAESGPLDGAAHLSLWRDVLHGAPAPAGSSDAAILVADGIAHLAADEVSVASADFERAIRLDPAAARAAFLSRYAEAETRLLQARLQSDCAEPTRPTLGTLETMQLEWFLDRSSGETASSLSADDRLPFELCLIAAKGMHAPHQWLSDALAFAASLGDPDRLTPTQSGWLGRTIWQHHDPLGDGAGPLAVGRRFMLSGLARIDDLSTLYVVSSQLANDCYARLDRRPCMRRVMEMAETSGKPMLALYAAEALAGSTLPEDRQRVAAMLDLFEAAYGQLPDLDGQGDPEWFRAYISYLRGLLAFTAGDPESGDWRRARIYLTEAKEHPAFRIHVVPILAKVVDALEGHAAAEQVTNLALLAAPFSDAPPTELANLYAQRFSISIQAGHGETFLAEMEKLPQATGCAEDFTAHCVAPWIWRAVAQAVYRHGDWQTVARRVTANVDHPYAALVSLILNAQGGETAGAPALMRRRWQTVDPSLWPQRIELEDEGVWREILLGYAVGEFVEGLGPEDLYAALEAPDAFAAHPLSKIGLPREEMLTEALFYGAMQAYADGDREAALELLRRSQGVGYRQALEHALALPLLAQWTE
ncbi:toll/interleukin-1 receptor domain-containing protein [Psychromarinibacter sp. C21-152]|uniref:Toll/interleukin-1 receptor domain-containing protein n=1 Tax=Psychromarinibacter sediminicola TaxID=3033385 RepID=A0AAE3NRC4_9RHOB|nr:toll/interleukin-1 receptor domain-containing protein [Psychromarinibacter sediminicola]MDF0602098.1 toll/interleukin-1 receptor domain-containing protein [Psychromarinibacter sediminicola]